MLLLSIVVHVISYEYSGGGGGGGSIFVGNGASCCRSQSLHALLVLVMYKSTVCNKWQWPKHTMYSSIRAAGTTLNSHSTWYFANIVVAIEDMVDVLAMLATVTCIYNTCFHCYVPVGNWVDIYTHVF